MESAEPALVRRHRSRRSTLRDLIANRIHSALTAPRSSRWWRDNWVTLLPWGLVALLFLAASGVYLGNAGFRDEVHELTTILASGNQAALRDELHQYGAWGPIVSVQLMVLQVLVAPIPAAVVQLANGVVYGQVGGALLNLVGQMVGAMLAFTVARRLGQGAVERLAGQANGGAVERGLERWGAGALFVIRAVPGMPSDVMSYVAGLTRMRTRTYVLATFAGYIPQSVAYAWLGDAAMTWFWWIIAAGFGASLLIAGALWLIQRRVQGGQRAIPCSAGA